MLIRLKYATILYSQKFSGGIKELRPDTKLYDFSILSMSCFQRVCFKMALFIKYIMHVYH